MAQHPPMSHRGLAAAAHRAVEAERAAGQQRLEVAVERARQQTHDMSVSAYEQGLKVREQIWSEKLKAKQAECDARQERCQLGLRELREQREAFKAEIAALREAFKALESQV